jgi:hypothetical protein
MASPLPAQKDNMVSELAVSYGEANAKLIVFKLPEGVTSEVTFLKLFVSTTYVDMTALEQSSPFDATRGAAREVPPPPDYWDEWTYAFKAQWNRSA